MKSDLLAAYHHTDIETDVLVLCGIEAAVCQGASSSVWYISASVPGLLLVEAIYPEKTGVINVIDPFLDRRFC